MILKKWLKGKILYNVVEILDGVSETERGQHEAGNSDMRSSFPGKTEVKQLHRELANG